MIKFPNQLGCYINRKDRKNENYVLFIKEDTYNVLSELGTYGAVLVYYYLCSQVPHTYDGKRNPKSLSELPFGLSPQAIREAYGNQHDIKTYREGIARLIELGILKKFSENIYSFDDIPLKYRVKTIEEKEMLDKMSAEQVFNTAHKQQLEVFLEDENKNKNEDKELEELDKELGVLKEPKKKYSWEI